MTWLGPKAREAAKIKKERDDLRVKVKDYEKGAGVKQSELWELIHRCDDLRAKLERAEAALEEARVIAIGGAARFTPESPVECLRIIRRKSSEALAAIRQSPPATSADGDQSPGCDTRCPRCGGVGRVRYMPGCHVTCTVCNGTGGKETP
jgi:hypothetical protein